MKWKETPTNERKKLSGNKLKSKIEKVVVGAIMKYNERNIEF